MLDSQNDGHSCSHFNCLFYFITLKSCLLYFTLTFVIKFHISTFKLLQKTNLFRGSISLVPNFITSKKAAKLCLGLFGYSQASIYLTSGGQESCYTIKSTMLPVKSVFTNYVFMYALISLVMTLYLRIISMDLLIVIYSDARLWEIIDRKKERKNQTLVRCKKSEKKKRRKLIKLKSTVLLNWWCKFWKMALRYYEKMLIVDISQ